jgi:hypothetical protein
VRGGFAKPGEKRPRTSGSRWSIGQPIPASARPIGLLLNFGGPHGTLIRLIDDESNDADADGPYRSRLNPEVYGTYDRGLWIETLQDWGWFGPRELRPDWYSTA